MKKLGMFFIISLLLSSSSYARSDKNKTFGLMVMGNFQLIDTTPNLDPGYGGGLYFDYRFNQRFSITADAWLATHDGEGSSDGDNSIELLGIPTVTLKYYFMKDEASNWDPYAGIGVGLYALTEGSVENGTNGFGLGAQIDVGFDYYFNNSISAGFAGIFHSVGIVHSLGDGGSDSSAILPFSVVGKVGYHF
ncbi:MAG TPA: hypothetical protein DDW49_03320 [Deltaproteobacteria bacterium]|nr:MAG: hypothetical protein A2048_08620 [Deltaproteobacteria bacterium GWA2_45_12]HBF12411.1 hypothetical protein [Deltaproteobacteria bacterium]